MSKTSVILISGFLGSGKTTLLNRLIEKSTNKSIGMIINDFGSIVVDGSLVREKHKIEDEALVEIGGGSIFCSCLASAFVNGLSHYASNRKDILYIEASGLSDPTSIHTIIKSKKEFSEAFEISAVVCLIDVLRFENLLNISAVEKQVKAASVVLLNKIDLVSDLDIEKAESRIREINSFASVYRSSYASANLDEFSSSFEKQFNEVDFHRCEQKPDVRILNLNKTLSYDKVKLFLNEAKEIIIRAKGYFRDKDNLYFAEYAGGEPVIHETTLQAEEGVVVFYRIEDELNLNKCLEKILLS